MCAAVCDSRQALPLSVGGVVVIHHAVPVHAVQRVVMRSGRARPSQARIHIPTRDKREQVLSSECARMASSRWFVHTASSNRWEQDLLAHQTFLCI